MTCYHPVAIEKLKPTHANYDPKHKIRFLGPAKDLLNVQDAYSTAVSDIKLIPCGKCIGCRIDKARDWAVRIWCEAYTSPNNSWFITLTYDDDHIGSPSLDKKDFQQFIKDLRNYVGYRYNHNVRYFGCGEYGDNSGRKHFHIILFDLPDLDFVPRSSRNGNLYFESKILNEIWDKGYVVIAQLNLSTASYVARYTLKKQGLKKYDDLGVQAPFILMSTRPGIGYNYFHLNHKNLEAFPFIFIEHKNYPMPRYFKRLFEEEYGIPTEYFNDDLIEKVYKKNLIKEIKSKNDLIDIYEAEELNLEAQQKRRTL